MSEKSSSCFHHPLQKERRKLLFLFCCLLSLSSMCVSGGLWDGGSWEFVIEEEEHGMATGQHESSFSF